MAEAIRGTFASKAGAELETRLWQADGEPRGIVQLVHGMAEHIDRYDETAKRLNAAGYTVVGHNQLGHGEKAEVKGYFADQEGWDAVLSDVHTLRTQQQVAGLPYFLLGHSMGSFVVRTYCLEHEKGLGGVILSGTGHFAAPIVTAGSVVAAVQCAFGMAKKPSKLIDKLNFSANNKCFENPRTAFDWLTRNEEHVDRYVADPHCGFVFTAGGYRDLFRGLKRLYPNRIDTMDKTVPVLLLSGDHDPVGGNGAGVKLVAQELKAAGVAAVTVKLYEGGRHEIFNEINSEEVCADLIAWLNRVGTK
ncbi:MAG: alpha/beta hydrolase [Clostridia bacterium]